MVGWTKSLLEVEHWHCTVLTVLYCSELYCTVLVGRTQSLLEGDHWHVFEPIFLFCIPMGSCALVTSMYLTVSIRWVQACQITFNI